MAKLAANQEPSNRHGKDLEPQEAEMEVIRSEIERLQDIESGQQRALCEFLIGLDLEG
jgi:hypothetical protein